MLATKVPPLLVTVLFGLVMAWIAHLFPGALEPGPWRTAAAIACEIFGWTVGLLAVWTFRRARTTVNPLHPEGVTSLVTHGIFRFSRNPMYVGVVALLLGWALWLGVPWVFLGPPALMLFLQRYQILPEERILTERFGSAYLAYCKRVRRWL